MPWDTIPESVLRDVREKLSKIDSRILDGQVKIEDRYCIASGAYGVVYKGLYNKSIVCIKIFKSRYIDIVSNADSNMISRLIHEVKVWRLLKHKHVVEFYGWLLDLRSPEPPSPSLVSKWCEHGDVRMFLRCRPDADRQALICGIAQGIAYLHSEKIVHGDIKPDNVVVDKCEVPKLCDFGASCFLSESCFVLELISVKTLYYAAPELSIYQDNAHRGMESDVWSFGCTAMEILRKQMPYCSTPGEAIFTAIGKKRPPFELKPSELSAVEKVVIRCLEYEKDDRPAITTLINDLINPREEGPIPFSEVLKLETQNRKGRWASRGQFHAQLSGTVCERPHCSIQCGTYNDTKKVRIKILRRVTPISNEQMLRNFIWEFLTQGERWPWADDSSPVAKMQGWELGIDDRSYLDITLISDWYPNGDVKTYLADCPNADANILVRDICFGLKYLHDRGIKHGNIKPTNILIDGGGRAALCDYGLSELFRDLPTKFQSVRYTAPEHLICDKDVFPCSYEGDIWAFGCVSTEIYIGQQPYCTIEDETEILKDKPPAYTADIVQRIGNTEICDCLNARPEERPSLDDVLDSLD